MKKPQYDLCWRKRNGKYVDVMRSDVDGTWSVVNEGERMASGLTQRDLAIALALNVLGFQYQYMNDPFKLEKCDSCFCTLLCSKCQKYPSMPCSNICDQCD